MVCPAKVTFEGIGSEVVGLIEHAELATDSHISKPRAILFDISCYLGVSIHKDSR